MTRKLYIAFQESESLTETEMREDKQKGREKESSETDRHARKAETRSSAAEDTKTKKYEAEKRPGSE